MFELSSFLSLSLLSFLSLSPSFCPCLCFPSCLFLCSPFCPWLCHFVDPSLSVLFLLVLLPFFQFLAISCYPWCCSPFFSWLSALSVLDSVLLSVLTLCWYLSLTMSLTMSFLSVLGSVRSLALRYFRSFSLPSVFRCDYASL